MLSTASIISVEPSSFLGSSPSFGKTCALNFLLRVAILPPSSSNFSICFLTSIRWSILFLMVFFASLFNLLTSALYFLTSAFLCSSSARNRFASILFFLCSSAFSRSIVSFINSFRSVATRLSNLSLCLSLSLSYSDRNCSGDLECFLSKPFL